MNNAQKPQLDPRLNTPPDRLIVNKFSGGRTVYTTGNKFIQITVDSLGKEEPQSVEQFDMSPPEIEIFMKDQKKWEKKLTKIDLKKQGQERDLIKLDLK